jgi:hypothetical protein
MTDQDEQTHRVVDELQHPGSLVHAFRITQGLLSAQDFEARGKSHAGTVAGGQHVLASMRCAV